MKLTKEKRAEYWREIGSLVHDCGELKRLFQGEIEIETADYAGWNMLLAGVFQRLKDLQVKFGVDFVSGDRSQEMKEEE